MKYLPQMNMYLSRQRKLEALRHQKKDNYPVVII
jgi:hypothetical protein